MKAGEKGKSPETLIDKRRSGLKKKKESPGAALQKLQQENTDLRERLLRTAAELDNVLKRSEREKNNLTQSANAQLIKAILPMR